MTILRKLANNLAGRQFAIMIDETTDISNTEQLVFCPRYVDDKLASHEEFTGLHSLESTTALSITHTIAVSPKDFEMYQICVVTLPIVYYYSKSGTV